MAAPLNSPFIFLLFSFLLSHTPLPSTSHAFRQCEEAFYSSTCSDALILRFPFTYSSDPKCGIYHVKCSNNGTKNQFEAGGRRYTIKVFLPEDTDIAIQDAEIALQAKSCNVPQSFTLPNSPFVSFELKSPNYTFLKCNSSQNNKMEDFDSRGNIYKYTCDSSVLYYWRGEPQIPSRPSDHGNCSIFQYPISEILAGEFGAQDLPTLLSHGVVVKWHLTPECADCHFNKRGICDWNITSRKFICSNPGNQI